MKSIFFKSALSVLFIPANILSQETKPNIILIFTDDLGYGDVGVFFQNKLALLNDRSQPYALTPNLDKMASNGVQLTNHYCAAPVSAPSRGSLLTGLSQGHANVRDNQFDKELADNHTLATVLKEAGYNTAAIGKWGLQGKTLDEPNWPAHPNKRGFDYFYGYMRHKDGHEHYPKEGIYDGRKEVYENYTEVSEGLDKCYTTDLWTAYAKRWIIEQKKGENKNKPFFVYLAYDTPHAVLELPTQAYPQGGGLKGGLQYLGKQGNMINTATGNVDSWIHPDYVNATYDNDKNPTTSEIPWPDVYKRYATDTRRIDDAVADIRQLLIDLNIDKNTLVVFTSDNGPSRESYLKENFEPNFFKGFGPFDGIKRDCFEGGVRVPAIACWPGKIPENTKIETPNISYDWLPTFAQIARIPAPANTDGVSLFPSLTRTGNQKEALVYVEYFEGGNTPKYSDFINAHKGLKRNQMQMIRFGDLVGVRYNIKSQKDNFEIYNIKTDPQQVVNLALKPEMNEMQQKMKDKVLQSRRPNESAARPYDNELIPAINVENLKTGVIWNAYKGEFPWVPNVSNLNSEKSGIKSNPLMNVMPQKWKGVLVFDGFILIPEDGEYEFSLTTDIGAFLKIHECSVIDEDFGYKAGTKISAKILLKKGFHPFLLSVLKNSSKPMLKFEWSRPGIVEQPLSSKVLFHSYK